MRPSTILVASTLGMIIHGPALALVAPQDSAPTNPAIEEPSGSEVQVPSTNPSVEVPEAAPSEPPKTESQTRATAEAGEPPSSVAIVVNPIALLFNMFNVDVGFAVADKTSANVSANYWSFDILGIKNTAWGLGFGAQYFFYRDRFAGAFVYPALEYANSRVSFGGSAVTGSLMGPSAIVGYQWNWHPFTIRVGGGGRYYFGDVERDGLKSDLAGFEFKADGSLGLAF